MMLYMTIATYMSFTCLTECWSSLSICKWGKDGGGGQVRSRFIEDVADVRSENFHIHSLAALNLFPAWSKYSAACSYLLELPNKLHFFSSFSPCCTNFTALAAKAMIIGGGRRNIVDNTQGGMENTGELYTIVRCIGSLRDQITVYYIPLELWDYVHSSHTLQLEIHTEMTEKMSKDMWITLGLVLDELLQLTPRKTNGIISTPDKYTETQ